MAQISKGDTFTDGQQVTGARLNQLVDSSTLLVGAITDQPSITANTLEATDSTIVNDAGVLKEATIGDILNSNLPITTSSINGVTGADIAVTPAAGQKFDVAGAFEANGINSVGALTVSGNTTVTGAFGVTGNSTLTGNATVTGNLAVNGTITNSGIQVPIKIAVLTRELTNGTQYIYPTSAWTDIAYNTLNESSSFVVNSSSFTGVPSSAGSGIVTIPAGTYVVEAFATIQSGGGAGGVTVRVYNSTTSSQIKAGNTTYCASYSHGTSVVYAVFTVATQTDIKIQFYAGVNGSTNTILVPSPAPEVIFLSKITKIA